MAFLAEEKTGIIQKYQTHAKDSGSTRVQVALITERLNYLQEHFKKNPKDHHGRRGLLKMVGQRKRLLDYLKHRDLEGYRSLIEELGLRK